MWRTNLGRDETREAQVVRALTAWADYVRTHPYAPRMFFRESTGIDEMRAVHRDIATEANGALVAIIGGLSGAEPTRELVMAAEVIRGGLTELATWWVDHPEVGATLERNTIAVCPRSNSNGVPLDRAQLARAPGTAGQRRSCSRSSR